MTEQFNHSITVSDDEIPVVKSTNGEEEFIEEVDDIKEAHTIAYNMTHSDYYDGEYVADVKPDHYHRTLPQTRRGRKQKAKREGWSEIGEFKSTFPSPYCIEFIPKSIDSKKEQIRIEYYKKSLHWRVSKNTDEFSESESEIGFGSFDECIQKVKKLIND